MRTERICFFGKIQIRLLESKNGFCVSLIKSKSELLLESTQARRTLVFPWRHNREIRSDVYGKRQTSDSSWKFLEIETEELTTV